MICSSSSSCASFVSFDDLTIKSCSTVKFLCSYYGRILPCFPNGKLRYIGGENRVLSVDRSISLPELQVKLKELCGWQDVSLRCQLPTEDLDALVSITSDEDLVNVIEEFDLANRDRKYPIKVRAFLHPSTTKFTKSNSSVSPEAAAPTRNKVPFWNPGLNVASARLNGSTIRALSAPVSAFWGINPIELRRGQFTAAITINNELKCRQKGHSLVT